jgi:hypothetical protein
MKLILICLSLLFAEIFFAQMGGGNSFQNLNLPYNARTAALGNDFISVKDQDLNLGIQNPSLYNKLMDKKFSYNHVIMASGINYGMLNYARANDTTAYAIHLRYLNYGKMDRLDEAGTNLGKFNAGDFILGAGYAKLINPYSSIGTNVNVIYSQLDSYYSIGLSVDFAANYQFKKSATFITVVAKNIGYQFKPYIKGSRDVLPIEAQAAISHKLKHAPFRISLLAHHLNKFDLTYNDPSLKPEIDPLTGDTTAIKRAGLTEKIFRHFTYQIEVILGKNLHLRSAFDYHRRQELKVAERPGIAGFSFGIGMYFKRFSLDYGLIAYSAAGYANFISINLNLDKFKK